MKKELIKNKEEIKELLKKEGVHKDLINITNYVEKNNQKLLNVVGLVRTNLYDVDDAIADAGLAKSSFYRVKQASAIIEDILEANDIDYTTTEYEKLIEFGRLLDRSMTNIQKLIKQKIMERFEGSFKVEGEGEGRLIAYNKPASVSELIKAAEFYDSKKRQDKNTSINIQNNTAVKTEPVIFNIVDPSYVLENLSTDNNNIYDDTMKAVDQIEEQLKNGAFDD